MLIDGPMIAFQRAIMSSSSTAERLATSFDDLVDHVRHVLPAQGPIGNFIHHNTLHSYQHKPFHQAIEEACALSGAEGYLSEERYRHEYRQGRITDADLDFVLGERDRSLGSRWSAPLKPTEIEKLILQYGIDAEPPSGLRYLIDERGMLDRLREDVSPQKKRQMIEETATAITAKSPALYKIVEPRSGDLSAADRLAKSPEAAATWALYEVTRYLVAQHRTRSDSLFMRLGKDRTFRDALVLLGAPDPAELINAWLVRFLSAYVDESVARWSMPRRSEGLLAGATEQLANGLSTRPSWQRRTYEVLKNHGAKGSQELIEQILKKLGVEQKYWPQYLSRIILELPGWAGMISRLETHPQDRGPGAPPISLQEYIALRLTMELECLVDAATALEHQGPIHTLGATIARRRQQRLRRSADRSPQEMQQSQSAYALFQLAQLAGLSAPALLKHQQSGVAAVLRVIDEFSSDVRRRCFQDAYEHQHFRQITDAIADNLRAPAYPPTGTPRFQVLFCIDDREEAIRRHFEELDPRHITFGAAGFFGVAMEFTSLDDPRANARCPIVVTPEHIVYEVAAESDTKVFRRRQSRRAFAAKVRHEIYDGAGSLIRGIALAPVLGAVAASQLFARVLFPRAATRWIERVQSWLFPTPKTQLTTKAGQFASSVPPPSMDASEHHHSLHPGFTEDERVARVRGLLENIGLVRNFAGLVVLLGHGASTVNNPHHSAYECGACGGRNGGPNARAFAAMANDPKVREGLRRSAIDIPDSCWFVGGWHDTTTDGITLFETDTIPDALKSEFAVLKGALDKARARSAHERCRKFEHAPATLEPEEALAHVEERAVDLSQARPELGHATNAVCVVGRRELTRGLFLDRRAFLVSYDPAIDLEGALIDRILAAIVPVGGGINLEYYFSTVDPERWGAGTKLPHNLSALIGVQDGVSGDLRTGLPRQMTEIHEPVRLLCIIEASPATLAKVLEKRAEVREFVVNEWIRVVSVDPHTQQMQVFRSGAFHPVIPAQVQLSELPMSMHGYRGQSGSIPPAKIRPSFVGIQGPR